MNFGRIYNFDLETEDCEYEIRKEIHCHQHSEDLTKIYSSLQNYIKNDDDTADANIKKKPNFSEIYNNKENIGDVFPNNVGYYSLLKNNSICELASRTRVSELKSAISTNFKHMKSVLGHISIVDHGDSIIPVPIYCISYSKDNELIFTGDNNG